MASPRTRRTTRNGIIEFFVILIVSFALVFGLIRPFVIEAFWIPTESMVPTLKVNDRVLVNKFIYDFTKPDRGDIARDGARYPGTVLFSPNLGSWRHSRSGAWRLAGRFEAIVKIGGEPDGAGETGRRRD